jgi:hypothetical protein
MKRSRKDLFEEKEKTLWVWKEKESRRSYSPLTAVA